MTCTPMELTVFAAIILGGTLSTLGGAREMRRSEWPLLPELSRTFYRAALTSVAFGTLGIALCAVAMTLWR